MSKKPSGKDNYISLHTLCSGLKQYLEKRLKRKQLWVVAEISNLKKHPSGHVYMDLVEMRDGFTVAKLQATIWSNQYELMQDRIGFDIDTILENGNKVLFEVCVVFHEVFGLKLDILNIDINYTLGELEKKRQITIENLKKEKLLDKNKLVKLPAVIQNFVLIAAEGSSGYKDFINQITSNNSGYKFNIILLNAIVQGDKAEEILIKRLQEANRMDDIDAVLILRGGGSKLDLEVFNAYDLCRTIANHKKAVLTGIGHETDLCVADLVAHTYLKTPTALAEFIHYRAHEFEKKVLDKANEIYRNVTIRIQSQSQKLLEFQKDLINKPAVIFEKQKEFFGSSVKILRNTKRHSGNKRDRLNNLSLSISEKVSRIQSNQKITLNDFETKLKSSSRMIIKGNQNHLTAISRLIYNIHPERLVEKGYATVSLNGNLLRKDVTLKIGDEVSISIYDKELICEVIKINAPWTLNLTNRLLKSLNK